MSDSYSRKIQCCIYHAIIGVNLFVKNKVLEMAILGVFVVHKKITNHCFGTAVAVVIHLDG